ncbi:UDP-glucosyltransferase 2-like isoform X2 [Lycorma delicatula]
MKLIIGKYILLFIIFGVTIFSTEGGNILVFLPVPAKSHLHIFKPFVEALVKRNHSITAFVSLPQKISSPNYKEITVKSDALQNLLNHDFFPPNEEVQTFATQEVLDLGYTICEDGFRDPEFQKLIRSSDKIIFDLIITEIPFYQHSAAALGYAFNAPLIALDSHSLTHLDEEFSGNPIFLPYISDISLPFGSKMKFFQRFYNTWYKIIGSLRNRLYNLPRHERLIKTYFKDKYHLFPPLETMLKNISLYIINSHPGLNPRPYLPNVVEVGGIHINTDQAEKVPEDLQKFMDEATDGFIYFSFGTNIPTHKMPTNKFQSFIDALSKINKNVIWKVELNDTYVLPKNIFTKKWIPQKQVLAHKNCVVFITHGGLLSIEEAVWFGVPLIGIPFFGDQPYNMAQIEEKGIGIKIEYRNISSTSLTWAVNEILNRQSYQENMHHMSKIFHDNALPVLNKAMYWSEYIIKYKGAYHLIPTGNYLPWYQYFLIDVIVSSFFIAFVCFFVTYLFLKSVIRKITYNSDKKYKFKSKIKSN